MKKYLFLVLALFTTSIPVSVTNAVDSSATQKMYRLYNSNSGEHFYTASTAEVSTLTRLGWQDEGVGWIAPKKSSVPVYRLYNPNSGDHHYTTSLAERKQLTTAGWSYEGIGWYSSETKRVPLYRAYNPNAKTGSHNYTTSLSEQNGLVRLGWKNEGIAWYGLGNGSGTKSNNAQLPYQSAIDLVTSAPVQTPGQLADYIKQIENDGIVVDDSVRQMDPPLMYLNLKQIVDLSREVAVLKDYFARGNKLYLAAPTTDAQNKNWINSSIEAVSTMKRSGGDTKITINFNPTYFNYRAYNYGTLSNLMKTAYADSYTNRTLEVNGHTFNNTFHTKVPVNKLPLYISTHEMGHIVDYVSSYNGVTTLAASSSYGRGDAERYFKTSVIDLSNRLSSYSYANDKEWFAELFTSYQLGGNSIVRTYASTILARQQLAPGF
jgi:hypothetical protein